MKSQISALLVSIFLLLGCSKVIYIPMDEGELKIVLSSLMNPDSSFVASVSSSKQLSYDPYRLPPDSMIIEQISLYEDDHFIGNLVYQERVFYSLPGYKPSAGKTYRIEVSAKEWETVKAITSIPDLVPIDLFDTNLTKINDDDSDLDVSLEFSDPIETTNYYALEVNSLENYWDWHKQQYTDSLVIRPLYPKVNGKADEFIDLSFLDVNQDIRLDRKLFFSDEMFNGKDFRMKFTVSKTRTNRKSDSVLYRVSLQHIDASYYKYAVSEQKYRNTRNNPFTEPVQVYTNVENGYGLFSSFNESVKEFMVYWTK